MTPSFIGAHDDLTGPENDLARQAIEAGGTLAVVIVITDQGPEWGVAVGSAGEPQQPETVEQFRQMLHACVDVMIDRALTREVGAA